MELQKEEFNIIRKDLEANDQLTYNICYIKDSYCLLTVKDKYYYIQAEYFGGYTITLYNKIDPYTKRQAGYPEKIKDFNELLNYIALTKNKSYKNLKDTYNQKLFFELYTYNKDHVTLLEHLKRIAGYREKYILDHLDYISEEEQNILKFNDKEGNYFLLNTKNFDRCIVG